MHLQIKSYLKLLNEAFSCTNVNIIQTKILILVENGIVAFNIHYLLLLQNYIIFKSYAHTLRGIGVKTMNSTPLTFCVIRIGRGAVENIILSG